MSWGKKIQRLRACRIFSFHFELLALVFAFSALLGLAVVYFPAKRAADTNPIDALRS